METSLTAQQINSPQTGQVTLVPANVIRSENNRSARSLSECPKDIVLSLKLSRDKMIEAVKNECRVPAVFKELLLAEIAGIDAKHDLLRLDFVRHAHGVGGNGCWTVKEI